MKHFIILLVAIFFASTVRAQVATIRHGGTGASTAAGARANIIPYFQNDATAPLTAPVVSLNTRSFGAGDSLIVTGRNAIGFGTRTQVLVNQAIGIGTIEDGNNSVGLLIKGRGSVGIGASGEIDGFAGVGMGWSFLDLQTSQLNDGNHGGNITIGNSSLNGSQSNNSIAMGTASECDSNDDIAIGHNAVASGHHTTLIGENSGAGLTGNYQINIGSYINGIPTSHFDSTTQLGAGVTTARNADEFVYGNSNATGSNLLFQFSDGNRHGNGAGFDVLKGNFDGTVTVGKAISIPGGTANQFLQTDGNGTTTWASESQIFTGGDNGSNSLFVNGVTGEQFWHIFSQLAPASGDPSDSTTGNSLTTLPIGTLKNLRLFVNKAPTGTNADTITLMKNGVATALTILVTGAQHTAIDNVHSVTTAIGDLFSIRSANTAGVVSTDGCWYVEFVKP